MGKQKNTGLGKALIRQRFNGKRHAKDGEQMYKVTIY